MITIYLLSSLLPRLPCNYPLMQKKRRYMDCAIENHCAFFTVPFFTIIFFTLLNQILSILGCRAAEVVVGLKINKLHI